MKKGRRRVLEAIFVRQWRTLGLRASWDRYTVGAKRRAGRVGVVVFAAVLLLLLLQQLPLLRVSCSIGGATRRGPRVAMRVIVTCRCALESVHLAQRAVVRDGAKTKWEREKKKTEGCISAWPCLLGGPGNLRTCRPQFCRTDL